MDHSWDSELVELQSRGVIDGYALIAPGDVVVCASGTLQRDELWDGRAGALTPVGLAYRTAFDGADDRSSLKDCMTLSSTPSASRSVLAR